MRVCGSSVHIWRNSGGKNARERRKPHLSHLVTNESALLVNIFKPLQAATKELVCCLPTQRGDKVRKSQLACCNPRGKLNLADELLAIDCSSSQLLLHFTRHLQNTQKNFQPGQNDALSQNPPLPCQHAGGAASPFAQPELGQSCFQDLAETTSWRRFLEVSRCHQADETGRKSASRDARTQPRLPRHSWMQNTICIRLKS